VIDAALQDKCALTAGVERQQLRNANERVTIFRRAPRPTRDETTNAKTISGEMLAGQLQTTTSNRRRCWCYLRFLATD